MGWAFLRNWQVMGFWVVGWLENLSFRDRFDILLEKRLSSVAEQ